MATKSSAPALRPPVAPPVGEEAGLLASFTVGQCLYAVDTSDVQEIIRVPDINQVPSAPTYVEGVIALRNRLLPIVNLRKRFGMDAERSTIPS